ncbi:PREDICTED: ribosyldihydronicotinamide dehydrogenase [quinone] [Bison bison bison]|uniref:Ribosyldihydronicotinamide dehydrogenase [quinone] n=1 Tax=Bison bison bison TaxID=43346 RepID=A0A6P3GSR4_BISBB|nr:PREDICTED: ribosyldihydronicotinamide dehydrogenase [quinone] [Bison bison bison]
MLSAVVPKELSPRGRAAALQPGHPRPPASRPGLAAPRGLPLASAAVPYLFLCVHSLTPGPTPRSGLSDLAGGRPGSSVTVGLAGHGCPAEWEPLSCFPGTLSNPGFFNYGVEAHKAYKKQSLSSDIIEEQKKLQEADLVIFQFPLYWFSVPAVLKGWMDRVLCQGFAFDFPGSYDDGFLKGKLAILSLTTGGTASMFSKTGVNGDFRYFLWPLQHGTLHFCGFKVLAPQISFGPEMASEEERKRMVASWAQRLKTLWEEEPIQCSPPWYFGQ